MSDTRRAALNTDVFNNHLSHCQTLISSIEQTLSELKPLIDQYKLLTLSYFEIVAFLSDEIVSDNYIKLVSCLTAQSDQLRFNIMRYNEFCREEMNSTPMQVSASVKKLRQDADAKIENYKKNTWPTIQRIISFDYHIYLIQTETESKRPNANRFKIEKNYWNENTGNTFLGDLSSYALSCVSLLFNNKVETRSRVNTGTTPSAGASRSDSPGPDLRR